METTQPSPGPKPIVLNFKMQPAMRDAFKEAAKKHGATMQAILHSLVESYIENADHLKVRVINEKGDMRE
jgi:hypothetical protein